jgi:putative endonuclease
MTYKSKELGNEGEERACGYLKSLGYKILERNLRLFCGEIDILAQDKKTIVLVEVKTVSGYGFGQAVDLVRQKKQEKLRTLAAALTQIYPGRTIRIDVIGIDQEEVTHYKNAIS